VRSDFPDLFWSSAQLLEEVQPSGPGRPSCAARLRVLTHEPGCAIRCGRMLDAGADDVLRKPFGFGRNCGPLRSLLRRRAVVCRRVSLRGPLEVICCCAKVMLRDQPVDSGPAASSRPALRCC